MNKQMMRYESEECDDNVSSEEEKIAQLVEEHNKQLDPTYTFSVVKVGMNEMMNT